MQVTFGYNFQFYGFVKPASLVSLLISAFLSIVKGTLEYLIPFCILLPATKNPL